jgi:hypothetical protein
LNIELIVTSVVILVVDHDGIAVFKRKSESPVAVDADRRVTGTALFEGVPAD